MKEMNNSIIIFGTGGHAKSVIRIIEVEAKWHIYGLLVDSKYANEDNSVLDYSIIGNRDDITQLQQDKNITKGFVAIGNNRLRATITDDLESKGINLIPIIHPTAIIMTDAAIGSGTMIHAQAILGADCQIGSNAIISAMVMVGHDSHIGEYVHLTPGVLVGGGATIGDFSFLGMGAAVLPNVKIGRNVQVGANAVVHKDLDDNVIVVGNPARVIKRNIPFI